MLIRFYRKSEWVWYIKTPTHVIRSHLEAYLKVIINSNSWSTALGTVTPPNPLFMFNENILS